MIVVKDLKKNYNGLDVLKGIDLTINKGDVVCLVGPSGCGKSTFLRCLTRLEEPDGGTVMLDGKEITERDIDATRAQMGMVFQHFNLFPHLTVKKNITLAPVRLGRMSQAAADKQAMELLEQAGYTLDSDGYYLELEMLVFSSGSYADCGKVMQSNLKEAGINMKLTVLESAAWNDRVLNGDFDMAMLNGYQGPDPDAMSKRIGTGGVANYSMYSNAEVDELLAKARSLTKDEERGECYRRIQEILAEELPIIPVVEMTTYYICRNNVSGVPYIDQTPDVSDNSYAKVVIE